MRAKDRTGLLGEEKAAEHLVQQGHRILERRWRTRAGELDLITVDGRELVAVEVKTRRGIGYGHPFEAITEQKLLRLRRLLNEYAAEHRMRLTRRRIDAVAVILQRNHRSTEPEAVLEHLKDLS
ncbi:YraN family protein [Nesterenkonia muleiensis]|uniref:YraN family protein n=1 Tax=Nesterenkonia muleiensis TaxID=2282648 RepID=UPI000E742ABD|nr:YraN family protein [Nesterenkonia muleiensis]